jgi:hypothetical protein
LKTLKNLFPLKKTSVVLLSLAYNSSNGRVVMVVMVVLAGAAKGESLTLQSAVKALSLSPDLNPNLNQSSSSCTQFVIHTQLTGGSFPFVCHSSLPENLNFHSLLPTLLSTLSFWHFSIDNEPNLVGRRFE